MWSAGSNAPVLACGFQLEIGAEFLHNFYNLFCLERCPRELRGGLRCNRQSPQRSFRFASRK
jgi:hypothetical protein